MKLKKTRVQQIEEAMSVAPQAITWPMENREFVKLWLSDTTIEDMSIKLQTSVSSISQRASKLRKKGVNLPTKLKRDYNSISELNKLIERYSK